MFISFLYLFFARIDYSTDSTYNSAMLKLHLIGTHVMNANAYKHAVKCSMLYFLSFLGAATDLFHAV